MGVIVRQESAANAGDVLLRTLALGQSTFEELIDTIANEILVRLDGMRRKARFFQRVVRAMGEIGNGVEQRPVQIENKGVNRIHNT